MNENLFDTKFLAPRGSITPRVYFVSESPDLTDLQSGTYSSADYNPLFRCLNELGLSEDQARFYYAVPYRPKNGNNSYERKLEDNELLSFSKFVLADIKKTNPEVIVCLGRNTSKIFGMNEPSVKALRHIEGKYSDIPIIFTYSSGYFNQKDGINSTDQKAWYSDIKKSFNYREHKERGDKIENIQYTLLDYSDSEKLENIFLKDEKLVLDYEASSLRPLLNKDFHIGGIGLYGMESQKAVYVYLYDFFRRYTNNQIPKDDSSFSILGEFLSKRKVIVFNAQYECAATVKFFEKQLTSLEDVMQLGRTLSETGGLKEIASRRLGLPVWTDKIEEWNHCFMFLIDALKKKKVTNKDEYEDIKETIFLKENPDKTIFDLAGFIESYKDEKIFSILKSTYKDFITNKDLTKEVVRNSNISVKRFWSLMQSTEVEFYNSFSFHSSKRGYKFETFMNETIPLLKENIFLDNKWNECLTIKAVETLQILKRFDAMLNEVFTDPIKLEEVKKELTVYTIERVDNDNFDMNFAEIPAQIVAPYCINDVIRTGELYTNLIEEITSKNLLGALEVYNDQELLGVELENNGIAWDDDKASKLEELYYDTLLTCGKSIILSSRMKKVLELTDQDIIKIQTTVNRDDLKPYFNPLSTLPSAGTRAKLSRALCSIRFKITMLFYEVHKEIEEIGEDKMPKYFPVFYPVYKQLREIKTFKERLEFIDSISKVENLRDRLLAAKGKDQLELQVFDKYAQYELESMDSKTTNDIYFGFRKILLIDPLDKTTWLEEFKLIVDFKTYKRAEKYRGTYIKAKLGRFNVSIVEKEDCKNNFFERKGLYINGDRKNENQVYLNETEYGVNTASTRRWRSGAHTVPAGVELMDLRISRFENGVRLHFDYSQMEVRVLAKLSNDPELLKLFEDESTDIHRMIASKVFKKDPKLISSTERKFAKTATFGILYGKSIYNFAQEMLNGDTKYAQEIFDSLFQAFPGIQRYINEYHFMALTTGKVKTIFGDELHMDMVPDVVFSLPHQTKMQLIENPYNDEIQLSSNIQEDRLMKRNLGQSLRDAQNWPIQSSASSIAGACIYNIVKCLKERHLSTKVDCFTHDAGDLDLELKDLPYVIKVLKREAVEVPKSKYGIPVNIDFSFGISGNNLLDLEECVVSDDEKQITTKFSGKKSGFEGLLKRLDNSNIKYEFNLTEESEKKISLDELFTEKGEFSLESQNYVEIGGDLKLIYN